MRVQRSRKRVDALMLGFSAWMADRHPRPLRPITRKQYVQNIRRAMRWCNEKDRTLIAGDLRDVRFVLGKAPPHPSSQNAMLNALRMFYDFLVEQGVRKDNPAAAIGRTPRPRTFPRPISIDDCCAYLDAASRLGLVHYTVAVLGMYMGLRAGEVARIRWADFFEVNDRWWCDVDGKGGIRMRMYVHPVARAVVTRLRRASDSPTWLFPSPRRTRWGLHVSREWPGRRHHEILEEAGLPRTVKFHQLRHSFATYLKAIPGVDIVVVQKGLRHTALSSTQVYADVLDDAQVHAIDQLGFGHIGEAIHVAMEEIDGKEEERDGGSAGPAG